MFNFKEKIAYAEAVLRSKLINGAKPISKKDVRRILIIKLDEIGDVVYASHVPEIISKYFDQKVDVWLQPFTAQLLSSSPHINKVFTNAPTTQYDFVLDLRPKKESLKYIKELRPNFYLNRAIIRLKNKRLGDHPHEVETNNQVCQLIDTNIALYPPKIYSSDEDTKAVSIFIESMNKPYAVFHMGARKELRRWPTDRFQKIANWLQQERGLEIVLIGSSEDQMLNNSLKGDFIHNIAGKFTLTQTHELIKASQLFIGNESGPLTLASVSGTQAIGLFGPGEPFVFYPWGKNTTTLHHVLDCNPCNQIDCSKETPCIQLIKTEDVLALL